MSNLLFVTREQAAESLARIRKEFPGRVTQDEARIFAVVEWYSLGELPDTCEWTGDSDGIYETSCDNSWCFVDGDIEDNEAKFCPFCGGSIKEESA